MKRLTVKRYIGTLGLLFLLLLTVSVACVFVGQGDVHVADAFRELPASGPERSTIMIAKDIVLRIRIPRILLAALVGGALSAAGVVFQALLRNPLADPYILGVSGGSSLGAVVAIVFGVQKTFGFDATFIAAFVGAGGSLLLVFSIARVRTGVPTHTLLLAGVIVNAFCGACIVFIISTVAPPEVKSVMDWLIGSINTWRIRGFERLTGVGVLVLIGYAGVFLQTRSLNLFALGERSAEQLGVNTRRARFWLLTAASLMTAAAVSLCGPIGFVGLIIPHAIRLVLGPDHRLLLPAAMLFGGAFLVGCDSFGRVGFQYLSEAYRASEIPVGVITAMVGGPFFLFLLRRRQRGATFSQESP